MNSAYIIKLYIYIIIMVPVNVRVAIDWACWTHNLDSEGDLKVRLGVTSFLFGIIMPIFRGTFITFTLGEMFVI